MNKHLLFLLLIVVAVLGATRLFQSPAVDSTPDAQTNNGTATATSAPTAIQSTLSQEKNGIDISIDAVEQRGDTTVLSLTLNNHQFDLSDDAIYDNATLNGAPSQSHTFLSSGAGGHHAQVEVVFPSTTQGSFTIAPTQDAVFTFDNLW